MAEPMSNALACIGAYASPTGINSQSVDCMINQERDKLIQYFYADTDAPEPCLAALHAACIYQILGLFGDSFLPAAINQPFRNGDYENSREQYEKTANLHSSLLLKMTRRLSTIHAETLHIHHEDENDWGQWKFMESFRRNFFFVHIINVLESKLGKLDGYYFEPLGDSLILSIPLPAPERMWRSCSSEEWFFARAQTLGPPSPSGSPETHQSYNPRTLGQLLEAVAKGQVDLASLLPLTRMLLACAMICPPNPVL
ncbi:hypothetical protein N7457_002123 [Penicillium paradoxum]|uniref:uncharacterized protein n=1 Tax=Penicillium paradoxum TaxID=176176 RepID=UPI002548C8EA|nr:uncharacterized protein N7457_002123 [Penicillium paradoxum]KAJ5787133.1 hypothetical protein N7457_002123 [Penicillium paradoxum]